jgi:FkbM family methyltransferase
MFPSNVETKLVQEFFQSDSGYFVDVGANDPEDGSQTFHLEQLGWTGVLIEPQPDLAGRLSRERRAKVYPIACSTPKNSGQLMPLQLAGAYSSLNAQLQVVNAENKGTIDVPTRTLDEVLFDAHARAPIDFLSIDVEGHEINVLQGFDFARWRPRLILVEDHVLNRKLHYFLKGRDYIWMRRTGLNSWYVPVSSKIGLGIYGQLQFIRKYYLGVPARQFRQFSRRIRQAWNLSPNQLP